MHYNNNAIAVGRLFQQQE